MKTLRPPESSSTLDGRTMLKCLLETSEHLMSLKDHEAAKTLLDLALSHITRTSRWQWSHEVDTDYFFKTQEYVYRVHHRPRYNRFEIRSYEQAELSSLGIAQVHPDRSTFRILRDGAQEAIHDQLGRAHRHSDVWIGLTRMKPASDTTPAGMLDPEICRKLLENMSDNLEHSVQVPSRTVAVGHISSEDGPRFAAFLPKEATSVSKKVQVSAEESQVLKGEVSESQVLKEEVSEFQVLKEEVSESQVLKEEVSESQVLKEESQVLKEEVSESQALKEESQVLKEEVSESPVGPKVESQVLKELTAAARTLDDRATDAWVAAKSTGRLDLAELCCTADSMLVDEMRRLGGTAERYSFWNGYDLSRHDGATKLLDDLLVAMPRLVWASPPCGPDSNIQNFNAHRRTPEQERNLANKRARNHKIQRNLLWIIMELEATGWCECYLEQPAGCASWRGTFADLKKQMPWVRTDGCAHGLRDEKFGLLIQKGWHILGRSQKVLDALGSRRCTSDHVHAASLGHNAAMSAGYTRSMCRLICRTFRKLEPDEVEMISALRDHRYEPYGLPSSRAQSSGIPRDSDGRPLPDGRSNAMPHIVIGPAGDSAVLPPPEPESATVDEETLPRNLPDDLRRLNASEFKQAESVVARLHTNMGHCQMPIITAALRRRKAHPTIIRMSQWWRCQACLESERLSPKAVASGHFEEPHATLGMDGFFWTHPSGHVHCRSTLLIDHGSRTIVVKVQRHGPMKQRLGNATHQETKATLLSDWFRYYGKPGRVRMDPDGAHRAQGLKAWLASHGVGYDPEPAEDHARIGLIERHVGLIKDMASRVARRLPDDTNLQELFDMCCMAHNDLHRNRGASPWQVLIGRTPHGEGLTSPHDQTPGELSGRFADPEGAMRRRLTLKASAYEEYIKHGLSDQSARAALAHTRRTREWRSGERVWYWRARKQPDARKRDTWSRQGGNDKQGQYLGPATVLIQGRTVERGQTRRKKVVWVADGVRLVRVSAHHLKPMSEVEVSMTDLSNTEALDFQQLVLTLRRTGAYDDMTEQTDPPDGLAEDEMMPQPSPATKTAAPPLREPPVQGPEAEVPAPDAAHDSEAANNEEPANTDSEGESPMISDEEFGRQQDPPATPSHEAPLRTDPPVAPSHEAPQRRLRSKTPASAIRPAETDIGATEAPREPKRPRLGTGLIAHAAGLKANAHSLARIPQPRLEPSTERGTSRKPAAVVEKTEPAAEPWRMKDLPEDQAVYVTFALDDHEADLLASEPELVLAAAIKRKGGSEVSVRSLSPDDRKNLEKSKSAELQSWAKNRAVEAALRAGYPARSLMKMRWVITRKDSGDLKARLVVLGFTDPDLGVVKTASPTCSRRGRQVFLSLAASMGFMVAKGDVKTAFLQGDGGEERRDLLCEPVKELREYLNLKDDEVVRLLKSVYGLVNAPRQWWLRIKKGLAKAGWEEIDTEPCFWVRRSAKGEIIALACVHVDDFLIAYDPNSDAGVAAFNELEALYEWGLWETGEFVQCGVRIRQKYDQKTGRWGTIKVDMQTYGETMQSIYIPSARRKDPTQPCTAQEVTELRAVCGQLMWLTTQAVPTLMAPLSILLAYTTNATVDTLLRANKLVRQAKLETSHPLIMHGLTNPCVLAWGDAAWGVRREGSSQGGYLIAMADGDALHNQDFRVNIISWHSGKLTRVEII